MIFKTVWIEWVLGVSVSQVIDKLLDIIIFSVRLYQIFLSVKFMLICNKLLLKREWKQNIGRDISW